MGRVGVVGGSSPVPAVARPVPSQEIGTIEALPGVARPVVVPAAPQAAGLRPAVVATPMEAIVAVTGP